LALLSSSHTVVLRLILDALSIRASPGATRPRSLEVIGFPFLLVWSDDRTSLLSLE
jgi:hypothetical protein